MALDIIPLPTLNGVSTSNMSAFAQMYEFNVYPQLHGTTLTIQDRLILASVLLAEYVTKFMSEHGLTELAN